MLDELLRIEKTYFKWQKCSKIAEYNRIEWNGRSKL